VAATQARVGPHARECDGLGGTWQYGREVPHPGKYAHCSTFVQISARTMPSSAEDRIHQCDLGHFLNKIYSIFLKESTE